MIPDDYIAVAQRAFPRIALIGYQTIASILSFFRNVVSESNQIDFFKIAQNDPIICGKVIIKLKLFLLYLALFITSIISQDE